MSKEADLSSHETLALHVATYTFTQLLGANPQHSNVKVKIDYLEGDIRIVHLFSKLTFVPDTKHAYRTCVSVRMNKMDQHWIVDEATVHLSHPRTGEWDEANSCTFVGELENGLEPATMFSTRQEDVDNVHHSATHLLPLFGSHFAMAA